MSNLFYSLWIKRPFKFWSCIIEAILGQMTQIKNGFCPPKIFFAKIYFSTSLESPFKMRQKDNLVKKTKIKYFKVYCIILVPIDSSQRDIFKNMLFIWQKAKKNRLLAKIRIFGISPINCLLNSIAIFYNYYFG